MMKIILVFILALLEMNVVKAYSAESYLVMDYDSGRVLMEKSASKKMLIASTTKIMTAIVAIENKDINSYREVGNEVLKSYGSAVYLSVGERLSLKDLLYALMLRSGNDAAIEIAYHVSGGMLEFTELMNKKAYELGLISTHFINNHGLEEGDNGNVSTAFDMAKLMRYAIKNDIFRAIINTKKYECQTNMKKYTWVNKNKLLHSYKYMLGGKTGYTKKAHRTLVTVSEKNHKRVIVVTLNDGNDFKDHEDMANEVFNNYERVLVVNHERFYVPADDGKYYVNNDLYMLLNEKEKKNVSTKIELNKDIIGDEAGYISVYLDNNYVMGEKIFIHKHLKQDNIIKRFFSWVFKW